MPLEIDMFKTWVPNTGIKPQFIGGKLVHPGEGAFVDSPDPSAPAPVQVQSQVNGAGALELVAGGVRHRAMTPVQAAAFDALVSGAGSVLNTKGTLLDPSSWTRQARQFSYTATAFSGLFWASVVRTAGLISNPLAAYYCYISSDHDAGAGGVGLFTGPSPVGPWTWYGVVWQDSSSGTQTETPSVVWDEAGQRLIMYYQQLGVSGAAGQQSTEAATSTDGLTWTKLAGFLNDVQSANAQHGDGHCGYFWPFQTDQGWMAYSLYGGTQQYGYVIWHPEKGDISKSWRTDGRSMGYAQHMTQGAPLNGRDCMVMGVVKSGGRNYAIVRAFDGTATGGNPQNGMVCIAHISDDFRHITSRPVPIWTPSGPESNDLRSVTWAAFDGVLYIYFGLGKTSMECISHVL